MSNKSLLITIVLILVLAGASVLILRTRQNRQELANSDQFGNQQNQANSPIGNPILNPSTTPMPTSTPTPTPTQQDTLNNCNRNFSPDKLKNDKVNIANRTVEMDVKGFGKIKLAFFDKDAPKTVENFLRLTNAGYFNCLTFHRVAKGFVIQGGDPTGTGSGGDSAFGGKFADELNPETPSFKTGYVKGVLAMANAGPNTNTSQFFILLDDANDKLQKAYTIFGKVTEGLDVVDKIGKVEINPGSFGPTDGTPKTPVVMQSVKIIK